MTARWLARGALMALLVGGHGLAQEQKTAGAVQGAAQPAAAVARPERKQLPPESGLSAEQLLSRAIGAMPDMRSGPVAEMLRGPLLLAYSRHMEGSAPLTVNHLLYTWPPDQARLELRVKQGSGRDSTSLLTRETGWLLVDGQRVEVARGELQAKIAGYTLQNLLRLHLELREQAERRFGGTSVKYVRREGIAGRPEVHILEVQGQPAGGGLEGIGIEAGTYRLKRVVFRGPEGVTEYEYEDYRVALAGLELPYRVELSRGGKVEDVIQIERLEVLGRGSELLGEPQVGRGAPRSPAKNP